MVIVSRESVREAGSFSRTSFAAAFGHRAGALKFLWRLIEQLPPRGGSSSCLRRRAAPRADLGYRQSQILAQRSAGEILPEQAPALQFRHHEAHEVLVGAGNVSSGDDEAVAGALR